MWHRSVRVLGCILILLLAADAHAGFEQDLLAVQQRWAEVSYQGPEAARKAQLETLLGSADALTEHYPGRAEAWLWAAVVRGSLAKAINGLSALGLVKEAKTQLEKAIAIDGTAEDGYAYGVLGQLYAKVPGWPIGFGSKKKAREYLQKGLAVNPGGINNNYFYAQFLYDGGDYAQAREYALRAQAAPPRTQLPVADSGRQGEIRALLEKIDKHLH